MDDAHVTGGPRPDDSAARFNSEFEGLEQRMLEANPGVQAVLDTYLLAQPAIHQFDNYTHITEVRPVTRTSNGSA